MPFANGGAQAGKLPPELSATGVLPVLSYYLKDLGAEALEDEWTEEVEEDEEDEEDRLRRWLERNDADEWIVFARAELEQLALEEVVQHLEERQQDDG